jgi:hypothetical protein
MWPHPCVCRLRPRPRLDAEEESRMLHWIVDAWLASFALFLELVDRAPLEPDEED